MRARGKKYEIYINDERSYVCSRTFFRLRRFANLKVCERAQLSTHIYYLLGRCCARPGHVMQGACTLCILHFMCVDIINLLMAPPKNAEEKSAQDLARNQCNGGFFHVGSRIRDLPSSFFSFIRWLVRCPDSDVAAPRKRREKKKKKGSLLKMRPPTPFSFRFYFSLDSLSRTVSSKALFIIRATIRDTDELHSIVVFL